MSTQHTLFDFYDLLLVHPIIVDAMDKEAVSTAEVLHQAVANQELHLDTRLVFAAAFVENEFLVNSRPVQRITAQRMGNWVTGTIMSFAGVFWIWAPRNEVIGYFASVEDAIKHTEGPW